MTSPANQDPVGPPTPTFPTNHVVGVVKDLQEGEQALDALRKAGHAEDHIHLIQSQEVVEGIQGRLQDRNLARKWLHQLGTSSDEGYAGRLYLEQARRGGHLLAVYASTAEQADQIAHLLSTYQVSLLKYFGRLSITDFPL
ncbi:MAG TPA: hypothetical protein VKT82_08440 [Ktedonobacterales bacterium]|nr:hypothetical protein [Ktedonobacterales bacterium]